MKLQIMIASLIAAFGLSAQAEDMSLVMFKTAPGVAVSDCESVIKLNKRSVVGRSGPKLTYITTTAAIVGSCNKIGVPNFTSYKVDEIENSCGSAVYHATSTTDINEKLIFVDNTNRRCKDIVPAKYVLRRSSPRARYRPMYASKKEAVNRPPIYHPGPEREIAQDSQGLMQALLENPVIGETLRHNNLTNVVKATIQATAPGIILYRLEAISQAMIPGKAIVTIEANTRGLSNDSPILYKISFDILE